VLPLRSQLHSKYSSWQGGCQYPIAVSIQPAKSDFNFRHSEQKQETEAKSLVYREYLVCILPPATSKLLRECAPWDSKMQSPEMKITVATYLKALPRKVYLKFLSTIVGASWYAEHP